MAPGVRLADARYAETDRAVAPHSCYCLVDLGSFLGGGLPFAEARRLPGVSCHAGHRRPGSPSTINTPRRAGLRRLSS